MGCKRGRDRRKAAEIVASLVLEMTPVAIDSAVNNFGRAAVVRTLLPLMTLTNKAGHYRRLAPQVRTEHHTHQEAIT